MSSRTKLRTQFPKAQKVIQHCHFEIGAKIDADTIDAVRALANAAKQNAVALTEAARAIQKAAVMPTGPAIQL